MSQHKDWLIAQSEKVVDLQDRLQIARDADDKTTCDQLFTALEQIADDVVGLKPHLTGDDRAYAMFMLGSICALMGLWNHAEEAYTQALDYWPDHVGLLNEMAECQFELQQYENAIRFLEKSIRVGGETPELIHELAVAQAWAGKLPLARITLINGLAKYPHQDLLKETLAEIEALPEAGKSST